MENSFPMTIPPERKNTKKKWKSLSLCSPLHIRDQPPFMFLQRAFSKKWERQKVKCSLLFFIPWEQNQSQLDKRSVMLSTELFVRDRFCVVDWFNDNHVRLHKYHLIKHTATRLWGNKCHFNWFIIQNIYNPLLAHFLWIKRANEPWTTENTKVILFF